MKKIIFCSIIAIAFLTSCGDKAPKSTNDSVAITTGGPPPPPPVAPPPPPPPLPPASGQVAAAKFQCPMKCEGDKTYDAPGQCPKCKMDLAELK